MIKIQRKSPTFSVLSMEVCEDCECDDELVPNDDEELSSTSNSRRVKSFYDLKKHTNPISPVQLWLDWLQPRHSQKNLSDLQGS